MELPPALFNLTIRAKKIFCFSSEERIKTAVPHYFVCLERTADEVLLMVVCTSKIEKQIKFIENLGFPYETLVFIKGNDIDDKTLLDKETCINCNTVFSVPISELEVKYYSGETMQDKGLITDGLYNELLIGVQKSRRIERDIKKLLPRTIDDVEDK
jgi:hypothetical protein